MRAHGGPACLKANAHDMANLHKSLITFGAGLMTAWTELRLKRSAVKEQAAAFRQLRNKLALTEQGRDCGLSATTPYAEFARNTPLRTYENLGPQLERMQRGAADVLWPGQCALYAGTAGTTTGRPKLLPVTDDMLEHFLRAGLDSLYYYTQRVGHAGIFQGRQLLLGGSAALTPLTAAAPFEAWCGNLSGIAVYNLPRWAEKHLFEPGAEIANQTDWTTQLHAIAQRTLRRDITLVAGLPAGLQSFAEILRQTAKRGRATPLNMQAVWPNLECIVHGGAPIGPFLRGLQPLCGPTVNFHEIYPAAEGFIAAQDSDGALGLRLLTHAGIFYEFLPLADYDEARPDRPRAKVVPLGAVQPGVDYVLLMTTPAGLCRYLVGDIVRFISVVPPRFIYVGRAELRLNAFDERVTERELTESLTKVCHQHDWRIVNFHVAPLFAPAFTGPPRGRHEWWIELQPGTVVTPTGPVLEAALDTELQRLNDYYKAKRQGGNLEAPLVRLVMPGVFEHWLRHKGKFGGMHKMPRSRADRAIADELAQIARFTSG